MLVNSQANNNKTNNIQKWHAVQLVLIKSQKRILKQKIKSLKHFIIWKVAVAAATVTRIDSMLDCLYLASSLAIVEILY